MNIYNNLLILFGLDCRIQVLGLEGGRETSNNCDLLLFNRFRVFFISRFCCCFIEASKIILNKLIEIQVDSYVFSNPYLVVGISLCPLYIGNYEDSLKKTIESNSSTMKSILINVAGNLLMFQPDLDSLLSIPEDLNKTKPVFFFSFSKLFFFFFAFLQSLSFVLLLCCKVLLSTSHYNLILR